MKYVCKFGTMFIHMFICYIISALCLLLSEKLGLDNDGIHRYIFMMVLYYEIRGGDDNE